MIGVVKRETAPRRTPLAGGEGEVSAEMQANRPKFSDDDRAALQSLTDADIDRAARGDPDNLPLSKADLDRMTTASRCSGHNRPEPDKVRDP